MFSLPIRRNKARRSWRFMLCCCVLLMISGGASAGDRGRQPAIEELRLAADPATIRYIASGQANAYLHGLYGELARQERFVLAGATCHMFPIADRFENYRVCNGGQVRVLGGGMIPIAGYGDITIALRSEDTWKCCRLRGVAHVPQAILNVISLTSVISNGHSCVYDREGATIMFREGHSMVFPFCGKLLAQTGYRPGSGGGVDIAHAASVPRKTEALSGSTDINEYHCAHGHSNELMLRLTASQQGIQLGGEMQECLGCSMARMLVRPIAMTTTARAAEKLERVFVSLGGEMSVPSLGGRRYILVVRDDFTRWTRVYFMREKSEATRTLKMYLVEYRGEGAHSQIMKVQFNNGRELFEDGHEELCRQHDIRQEITNADSPENNGVAERALGMILDAALAARIQAPELYPGAPTYPSLWAEAVAWACDALNRTATTGNPGNRSPYELWHGHPAPPRATQPFLRPAIVRLKTGTSSEPEPQRCFYLGPEVMHPRGGMRVLTQNRTAMIVRNIAWQHLPAASEAASQMSTTSS